MENNLVVNNFDVSQRTSEVGFYTFTEIVGDSKNFHFRPSVLFVGELEEHEAWGELSLDEFSIYEIQVNTDEVEETWKTDHLLDLVGTLELDVAARREYYNTSGRAEIRVVKGVYENHPDPLIALLGTLESNVTHFGERHDDYIGDALLAELWGNEDG